MKKKNNTFTIIGDTTKEEADRLTELGLKTVDELEKEIVKIEKTLKKLPAHARLNFFAKFVDILWVISGLPDYLKREVLNNIILHSFYKDMKKEYISKHKDAGNYIG